MLTIIVRVAKDIEAVRRLISRFDSKDAARSDSDMIGYVFGNGKDVSKRHIKKVNTGLQNIIRGCPQQSIARVRESIPTFSRERIVSYEALTLLRDHFDDLLKWFQNNFSLCFCGRGRQSKLMNAGVSTTIILTRLVDGDEVADVWKRYLSGDNISGPLRALRDDILANDSAGEKYQREMFHRSLYAYLAEKRLYGAHRVEYKSGQIWQISRGLVSEAEPKHIRAKKGRGVLVAKAA